MPFGLGKQFRRTIGILLAGFISSLTYYHMASSSSSKDEAAKKNDDAEAEPTDAELEETLFAHLKKYGVETWEQLKKVVPEFPKQPKVLDELTMDGVAKFIKENKAKKIIVMTGAGVSTSAGIPDFRSPGTGLYHNLQKYNLPHPQAIFEIGYFYENPEPFFALAKELFPTKLKPTVCHYFIRLLMDKGVLLRVYTQNIDSLDHIAGVPAHKIVEAHGSFYTNHCVLCNKEYTLDWMKEQVDKVLVPRCTECKGVVKPDVVFFGEALPSNFFNSMKADFPECDLLIIMGTSLVVQPFASLVDRVKPRVPRLLINLEKAGSRHGFEKFLGMPGLDFDEESNYRDCFWQGSCDDGSEQLAKLIGWEEELKQLKENGWKKIEDDYATRSLSEQLTETLKLNKSGDDVDKNDSTKPKI